MYMLTSFSYFFFTPPIPGLLCFGIVVTHRRRLPTLALGPIPFHRGFLTATHRHGSELTAAGRQEAHNLGSCDGLHGRVRDYEPRVVPADCGNDDELGVVDRAGRVGGDYDGKAYQDVEGVVCMIFFAMYR